MPRLKRVTRFLGAVGVLVAAGSVVGCATASDDRATLAGRGSAVAPPTPFVGPWASLMTDTYADASPAERDALADGVIDELERSFFRDRVVACLSDLGVEASFAEDGSLDYTNNDGVSEEEINACMSANGVRVLTLHDAIARNPENLDESTIMVRCLQEAEVVGPEYTTSDFEAGRNLDELADEDGFVACTADPLGLTEG